MRRYHLFHVDTVSITKLNIATERGAATVKPCMAVRLMENLVKHCDEYAWSLFPKPSQHIKVHTHTERRRVLYVNRFNRYSSAPNQGGVQTSGAFLQPCQVFWCLNSRSRARDRRLRSLLLRACFLSSGVFRERSFLRNPILVRSLSYTLFLWSTLVEALLTFSSSDLWMNEVEGRLSR